VRVSSGGAADGFTTSSGCGSKVTTTLGNRARQRGAPACQHILMAAVHAVEGADGDAAPSRRQPAVESSIHGHAGLLRAAPREAASGRVLARMRSATTTAIVQKRGTLIARLVVAGPASAAQVPHCASSSG
jgi:hypothetical protein